MQDECQGILREPEQRSALRQKVHPLSLGGEDPSVTESSAAHFTADRYEIPQKDGKKISPDRRSGSVFHIKPSLLMDDAVVTRVEGYWKFSDSAVLRDKSGIRSRKGSDSKWALSKICKKKIFPATQNSQFGGN